MLSERGHQMTTRIRAQVQGGHLVPLEEVKLPEGTEVEITIAKGGKRGARAFQRSAGSWEGLVDADKLIRAIYRDRLLARSGRLRL